MTTNNEVLQSMPSVDPANLNSPTGMMQGILNKFLQNIDDCLPAIVVSYDRVSNTATVKPLVQVLATTGETVPRATVASVPVLALGGGNFFINFPLKAGDLGWIKASDRDISLFKQGMAESKPNTLRKHSFEDGVFIPDVLRNYTIDGEDLDDNLVVQHKDGKVRVAVWCDRVKVTCNDTYVVVKDDGNIEAVAPEKILFDTPLVEFTGSFITGTKTGKGTVSRVIGGLHTTEIVKSDTDIQAQSVSLHEHTHQGVISGGDTTAEPVK